MLESIVKLKIIIINSVLILLIYFFFDLMVYNYAIIQTYKVNQKQSTFVEYIKKYNKQYLDHKYLSFDKLYDTKIKFRPNEGMQYKKKPILLFGCSFTYGQGPYSDKIFSHKLSKYAERPVYNRSFEGWGVQDMLYQLKRNDFYTKVKEPEYIIYTYINGHIPRLYYEVWMTDTQVFYKNTPKGLEENKFFTINNPFYNYIVKGIHWVYFSKLFRGEINDPNFWPKTTLFLNQHFIESKKEAEKHWKNSKFVIFVYSDSGNEDWKALEKEGFIIIKIKDLTTENIEKMKYRISKTDVHPSEAAWNLIIPLLTKKLNMD